MDTQVQSTPSGKYGWVSFIIGLIFIAVGVWCICTPASTLAALTLLFIISFFVGGAFELFTAFATLGGQHWGWRMLAGIIDILLGIWLCAMPAAEAATALVYVVGFYIFFYSVMGIVESCALRRYGVKSWGWMLACNIVGVICSFMFLLGPAFGGLFTVWLVGLSFITYGTFRCFMPSI